MSIDRDDPRDDREDLEERIGELEATLRELRTELQRPPEGPFGLPRPPTPREVLAFTGEYGIPTAIAMLEANVRALKALQQVIRLVDPEYDSTAAARGEIETRATDAGRATLDRLQDALADVEQSIKDSDYPQDPTARRLLDDARTLNDDILDDVSSGREQADTGRDAVERTDAEDAEDAELDELGDRPAADVESELRSIREELEPDDDGVTIDVGDAGEGEADANDEADGEDEEGDGRDDAEV